MILIASHIVGISQEHKDPGGYIPFVFLLIVFLGVPYFGVPILVPLQGGDFRRLGALSLY